MKVSANQSYRILKSQAACVIAILLSGWRAEANAGRRLEAGLYQLTGTHLTVGQTAHAITELADPAPPFVNAQGQVEIYGSAPYFIRYPSWREFSRGGAYEIVPLALNLPGGIRLAGVY